jgi:hypothetical protein
VKVSVHTVKIGFPGVKVSIPGAKVGILRGKAAIPGVICGIRVNLVQLGGARGYYMGRFQRPGMIFKRLLWVYNPERTGSRLYYPRTRAFNG